MDVLQNMMLFSELVQCGGNVYTWCYDAQEMKKVKLSAEKFMVSSKIKLS